MGKESKRRPCLIGREEETLRYDLALGKITFKGWTIGMQMIKQKKDSKLRGSCGNCEDGIMTCPDHDYKITCRITGKVHSPHYTCVKFREDM